MTSDHPEKPGSYFPEADETPCTRIGEEDSITEINTYSRLTNQLQSLEQSPEEDFLNFGVGTAIDGYALISPLHASPRSKIFYAVDLQDGKKVAVKKFSQRFQEEFNREIEIQNLLRSSGGHRNILLAEHFIEEKLIQVTPYLNKGTVRQFRKRKIILNPYQAKMIVSAACDGLSYIHRCGIVHRDVKSQNMALSLDPEVEENNLEIAAEDLISKRLNLMIFDFEIGWHPELASSSDNYNKMVGTPYYLAPEVIKGSGFDQRSDIYSFGITLFEILCGKLPFQGREDKDVLNQHLHVQAPEISRYNPLVGRDLQAIVEKALAKDPEHRYQSAAELKKDYLAHLR